MTPLDRYMLFASRDLDQARDMVARRFCRHRLETVGKSASFDARHNCAEGVHLAINYIRYGATVLIEPGELQHFYLVQLPLRGHAEISNGGVSVDSCATTATILNPDRHTAMIWHAGCEQLLIYIDRQELLKFAERHFGRLFDHPIVFEPEIDLTRPDLARWRQQIIGLFAAADAGHLFGAAVSINQGFVEQQLLEGLLTLQPSNVSQFANREPSAIAASHVTRARQFIVEHADHPIALSDIASAAGVPIRTLQHGLRQATGTSPMQLLRDERLMRVRCELNSGHSADTVTVTAAKWGFSHFGRFSGYYRQAFGELPSATLARAQASRMRAVN